MYETLDNIKKNVQTSHCRRNVCILDDSSKKACYTENQGKEVLLVVKIGFAQNQEAGGDQNLYTISLACHFY